MKRLVFWTEVYLDVMWSYVTDAALYVKRWWKAR